MASSPAAARPVRVLYVLNFPARGGPATSLATLIQSFPAASVVPHVYSPGRASSDVFEAIGVPVSEGPVSVFTHFRYFVYRGRDWLFFAKELLLLPFHAAAFGWTLVRVPCDIVHLNEANLFAAAALARLFGKRVVCHVRSALPESDAGLRARALRWAYRTLCDRLIAIESATLRPLAEMPHARVIANPVDVRRFAAAAPSGLRERIGVAPDAVVVAILGRASPDEGLAEIVDAARRVCASRADVSFLWIGAVGGPTSVAPPLLFRIARALGLGTGQFDHRLRELIAAHGLERRFLLPPFQEDIWSVYQEVDIVITGGHSGLGRQVLEAGAAGRPVIGLSDHPDPDLIADGETGYLVPLARADLLAQRILELAADPELRHALGERGRLHADRFAAPERVAAQVLEVYREALRSGG